MEKVPKKFEPSTNSEESCRREGCPIEILDLTGYHR